MMKRKLKIVGWILSLVLTLLSCGGGDSDRSCAFNWSVTFDPKSYEPFGTAIVMKTLSLAHVSVQKQDSTQTEDSISVVPSSPFEQFKNVKSNLLYVTNGRVPLDEYADVIRYRSQRGLATIIAANDFGEALCCNPHPFDLDQYVANSKSDKRDKHTFKELSCPSLDDYFGYDFHLPEEMCGSSFSDSGHKLRQYLHYSIRLRLIFLEGDSSHIAVEYYFSQGAPLIIVSAPLLFTNYSMLCKENASLVISLLRKAEADVDTRSWSICFNGEQESPKNAYFYEGRNQFERPSGVPRKEKPSEFPDWLQDLLIIGAFICFLLLCARRRQRIVPYIPEPKNQTVDYAKQVSLNYYWRKEYPLILRKKYIVFKDVLQEKTHINLNDLERMEENIALLEKITGMEEGSLQRFFRRLQALQQNSEVAIDWEEMKSKIDKMNLLISKLK